MEKDYLDDLWYTKGGVYVSIKDHLGTIIGHIKIEDVVNE